MRRFFNGALMLGLLLGTLSQAWSASLYWSNFDGGDIRRANLDGTSQAVVVSGLSMPQGPALDLARGKMWWSQGGNTFRQANLDGTRLQTLFSNRLFGAPTLSAGEIFWTDPIGLICVANLDGSQERVLVDGLTDPRGPIFVDRTNSRMFWTDFRDGTILQATLSGASKTTLVSQQAGPDQVTVDVTGGKMYWTSRVSGEIRRASLNGSGIEVLVQGLNAPSGIALDTGNSHIYWTEFGGGKIQRSNLDGTGRVTVITGQSGPSVLTLDLSPDNPPKFKSRSFANGTYSMTWSALIGRSYQLQFKTDWNQEQWTDLGVPRTATRNAMGGTFMISDSDPQGFFRVLLVP